MIPLHHLAKIILDAAESFFAGITFRIIELKDRWWMSK